MWVELNTLLKSLFSGEGGTLSEKRFHKVDNTLEYIIIREVTKKQEEAED